MQNHSMSTFYFSAMHWEKMAVIDILFRQRGVIEFPVEGGNSAGATYEQIRGVYGDDCIGASSVTSWVENFKYGSTDIADQPSCGRQRTAATEHNKQKDDEFIRDYGRVTVKEIAAQPRVGNHET
jgi:transposase